MRFFAVCIRDSASGAFHTPLFVPAIGLGERFFRDECNSPSSEIAKHPEDYELHLVGSFDNETGELVADTPRLLLRGLDVRKPS